MTDTSGTNQQSELFVAARDGKVALFKTLLKDLLPANATDKMSAESLQILSKALCGAASMGHSRVFEVAFEKMSVNQIVKCLRTSDDTTYQHPLSVAALFYNEQMIPVVIKMVAEKAESEGIDQQSTADLLADILLVVDMTGQIVFNYICSNDRCNAVLNDLPGGLAEAIFNDAHAKVPGLELKKPTAPQADKQHMALAQMLGTAVQVTTALQDRLNVYQCAVTDLSDLLSSVGAGEMDIATAIARSEGLRAHLSAFMEENQQTLARGAGPSFQRAFSVVASAFGAGEKAGASAATNPPLTPISPPKAAGTDLKLGGG